MSDEQGGRDPKTGRFLPGHSLGPKNPSAAGRMGGRPSNDALLRIRTALEAAISNGTLKDWAAAVATKIREGDLDAAAFVFDRILGKPRQGVDLGADDTLREFMAAWMTLEDPTPGDG